MITINLWLREIHYIWQPTSHVDAKPLEIIGCNEETDLKKEVYITSRDHLVQNVPNIQLRILYTIVHVYIYVFKMEINELN